LWRKREEEKSLKRRERAELGREKSFFAALTNARWARCLTSRKPTKTPGRSRFSECLAYTSPVNGQKEKGSKVFAKKPQKRGSSQEGRKACVEKELNRSEAPHVSEKTKGRTGKDLTRLWSRKKTRKRTKDGRANSS